MRGRASRGPYHGRGGSFPIQPRHRRSQAVERTVERDLSDPMVGRVLDGRYRIGPRIARGGMATVYEATDLRLDRVVAVKVMHPGLGDDDDVRRPVRPRGPGARPGSPTPTWSRSSTRATTTAPSSSPWSTSPATRCAT